MARIKIRLKIADFIKTGFHPTPDQKLVEMIENEIPGYVCAVVDDPKVEAEFEGKTCAVLSQSYSYIEYAFEPFHYIVRKRIPRDAAIDAKGNIVYRATGA